MSNLQPGWVDQLTKAQSEKKQAPKINTDPPLWDYLRIHGKKPTRLSEAKYAEARSRGGFKAAKSKAARRRASNV